MKKEFLLGCNYWASNAGTDMWVKFDIDAIDSDLKLLSEHGVTYLRVFPTWRDFQPVKPTFSAGNSVEGGNFKEYRMEDDSLPENPYFLSEVMLERFDKFCDVCDKYGVKLNVSLITGFMSGRMLIPSAAYSKNLYSDPKAVYLEQLFVKGFVERFKHRDAIASWDWGNETNVMDAGFDPIGSVAWGAIITNAIRSVDNTRPIMNGVSEAIFNNVSTIKQHALYLDVFNTHPYPYWYGHARLDKVGTARSMMYSAAETSLHKSLSGKPVLVQETGTMGPMVCGDELSADFLRVNLFSNWAQGAEGVMWWCANEQIMLDFPPYSWSMIEVELGLSDKDKKPKPVLSMYKEFSEWLKKTDIQLPEAHKDATCLLIKDIDVNAIGYMHYVLTSKMGMNVSFAYVGDGIPDSDIYIMPAVSGSYVMDSIMWKQLLEKVRGGAKLYMNDNGGVVSMFNELVGMTVVDSDKACRTRHFSYNGCEIDAEVNSTVYLKENGAEVLAKDETGNPIFTKNKFGDGEIYYLGFSPEKICLNKSYAFDAPYHKVYEPLFNECKDKHMIVSNNSDVCVTQHFGDKNYCVLINYSDKDVDFDVEVNPEYEITKVWYGDTNTIKPFDACVVELAKK